MKLAIEPQQKWKKFSATLMIDASLSEPEATFELVAEQSGTVWLDAVSLIPGTCAFSLVALLVF